MTKQEERTQLLQLFNEKALQRGEFTLVSGAKSSYYIDGKLVTFHPQGAYWSARMILDIIRDQKVDAVGGMAMGAIPIACAVAALSAAESKPVASFTVRKESKGHGTQKRIEGYLEPNWRVVLLEDVISTGNSTLKAIEQVEKAGAKVIQVVALLDRLMGAQETLSQAGYPLVSLFTRKDLNID